MGGQKGISGMTLNVQSMNVALVNILGGTEDEIIKEEPRKVLIGGGEREGDKGDGEVVGEVGVLGLEGSPEV